MKKKPEHALMTQFPCQENCLLLAGIPLTQIANRAGASPFYVYDKSVIQARIKHLKAMLPPDIRIHYAIKANPMPALVQFMSSHVDGFDLASQGEMNIALSTDMPSHKISFAGPGKQQKELNAAVAAGVTINLESNAELDRVMIAAENTGQRPQVAVRVNPDFELKSSGMKMSGGPKQFGIDAEITPAILKRLAALDVNFKGLHIFSGSQNLRPEAIIEAQQKTFELAIRLAEHAPAPIEKLNIGGGFGIPYFPGEVALDISSIGDHLSKSLPKVYEQLGKQCNVIIELGRYLVGEAGLYVSKVIERKISRGKTYLITDGGLHHHLAASGNFGQIIRKNYPVVIGNKMNSSETEEVSVVGPLCTPLDILADNMVLAKADVGDWVVVYQSGAYGYSASPHHFLSHPHPTEILI